MTEEAERKRLRAVRALQLLDTRPEPEFDDIAQLAASICGTAYAAFSLVDEHRVWFKSCFGLKCTEVPRSMAICKETILSPDLLYVEDATKDDRFATSPLVTDAPHLRFYAGLPVSDTAGHHIGTLCVLDWAPRRLSDDQRHALKVLARQVNVLLELRSRRLELEGAYREAQRAKERAEAAEVRFQIFMNHSPFLSYIKDSTGAMLYYNHQFAQHFQVSCEALLDKRDGDLWPEHLAAVYRRHDLEVLATGETRVLIEETENPDGSSSSWRSYKFSYKEPNGTILLGGVSIDVTEELRRDKEILQYQTDLEQANRRLTEIASSDALTGLANRRSFEDNMRQAFQKARALGQDLTVLLVDVDHFKSHNDRFGHTHGDNVLRTLAQLLKEGVRTGDFVARLGGEEFVLLLPRTSTADADRLGRRLIETIRLYPWPCAPVTVSIGLSTLHPATRDTQHLIDRADEALYAAKHAGRNCLVASPHAAFSKLLFS